MVKYEINVVYGENKSINEIFVSSLIKEVKMICKNHKKGLLSLCTYLNLQNKDDK